MFPQLSAEEWQEVKWHVVGKTGECAAWNTDRQPADGLGSKPGKELPFLDGSLTDAVWWLEEEKKKSRVRKVLQLWWKEPEEMLQNRCVTGQNMVNQLKKVEIGGQLHLSDYL